MTGVVRRAARAILIDDSGRLLLIRRTRPGLEPYWTTPGGGVEPTDESVEQAIVRELREELGAEVSDVQPVLQVSGLAGDAGVTVQHFFVCRLLHLDLDRRHGPELFRTRPRRLRPRPGGARHGRHPAGRLETGNRQGVHRDELGRPHRRDHPEPALTALGYGYRSARLGSSRCRRGGHRVTGTSAGRCG